MEGSIPAVGSAMAYVKAHIQEGRGWDEYPVTAKHDDLAYSESTSLSGIISSFTKSIAYQSGKSLVG